MLGVKFIWYLKM